MKEGNQKNGAPCSLYPFPFLWSSEAVGTIRNHDCSSHYEFKSVFSVPILSLKLHKSRTYKMKNIKSNEPRYKDMNKFHKS